MLYIYWSTHLPGQIAGTVWTFNIKLYNYIKLYPHVVHDNARGVISDSIKLYEKLRELPGYGN